MSEQPREPPHPTRAGSYTSFVSCTILLMRETPRGVPSHPLAPQWERQNKNEKKHLQNSIKTKTCHKQRQLVGRGHRTR